MFQGVQSDICVAVPEMCNCDSFNLFIQIDHPQCRGHIDPLNQTSLYFDMFGFAQSILMHVCQIYLLYCLSIFLALFTYTKQVWKILNIENMCANDFVDHVLTVFNSCSLGHGGDCLLIDWLHRCQAFKRGIFKIIIIIV